MGSLDSLESRYYNREQKCLRVVDDSPIVYRIKHVGTGTTQTPTVVISSTGSLITLTDGAAAATAIDLSATAYNTVGEVVDYINGLASWKCKLLDGLRSDASDNMMADATISSAVIDGETVWDLKQDTSLMAKYRVRVTYDRTVVGSKAKGSHRVTLKEIRYYADLTAAANIISIYEWNATDKTETLVWTTSGVDTTDTTHDLNGGLCPGNGNDLIVEVAGTVVDHNDGFLQAQYERE